MKVRLKKTLSLLLAFVMSLGCMSLPAFAEYDKATVTAAEAVASITKGETTYNYASLKDAVDDAQDGDTVTLLQNVTISEAINLTKTITIQGNALETLTITSTDSRVFNVSNGTEAVIVTLKDLAVTVTSSGDDRRGISLGDNLDATLILDHVSVSSPYYAINVAKENTKVAIKLQNASVSAGWAGLNIWSKAAVEVTGGTISGVNDKTYNASGSNNFSTVVMYEGSEGSTLSFKNAEISAETVTGNAQWLVDLRTDKIDAAFEGCALTLDSKKIDSTFSGMDVMVAVKGKDNSLTFTDCTFQKNGSTLGTDGLTQLQQVLNNIRMTDDARYATYIIDGVQYVGAPSGGFISSEPDTVSRNAAMQITGGTYYMTPAFWHLDDVAKGYGIYENEGTPTTYTVRIPSVTFDTNHGSLISSDAIAYGTKVDDLPEPKRPGYDFKGWTGAEGETILNDASLTAQWDNSDFIGSNKIRVAGQIDLIGADLQVSPNYDASLTVVKGYQGFSSDELASIRVAAKDVEGFQISGTKDRTIDVGNVDITSLSSINDYFTYDSVYGLVDAVAERLAQHGLTFTFEEKTASYKLARNRYDGYLTLDLEATNSTDFSDTWSALVNSGVIAVDSNVSAADAAYSLTLKDGSMVRVSDEIRKLNRDTTADLLDDTGEVNLSQFTHAFDNDAANGIVVYEDVKANGGADNKIVLLFKAGSGVSFGQTKVTLEQDVMLTIEGLTPPTKMINQLTTFTADTLKNKNTHEMLAWLAQWTGIIPDTNAVIAITAETGDDLSVDVEVDTTSQAFVIRDGKVLFSGTVTDAFNSTTSSPNDTIQLNENYVRDIELGGIGATISTPLTLDLNGKTLTGAKSTMFSVGSGRELTIINSSKNPATIQFTYAAAPSNSNGALRVGGNNAVLNIGREGEDNGIVGDIKVLAGDKNVLTSGNKFAKINVYGGSFTGNITTKSNTSEITIYGGTFDHDPTAYVDPGYEAVYNSNDKVWTVRPETKKVAQIGETKYTDITTAIQELEADETLELLDDVVNPTANAVIDFVLPEGAILEGNDHKLEGNVTVHINKAGGTVQNVVFQNITNAAQKAPDQWSGKGSQLSALYAVGLTGTLTVTGCTFENISWDAIQATPVANASVVITGNTFKALDPDYGTVRHVHVQSAKNVDFSATVTGNKFYNKNNLDQTALEVYYYTNSTKVDLTHNYFDVPTASCVLMNAGKNVSDTAIFPVYADEAMTQKAYGVASINRDGYNVFSYYTLQDAVNAAQAGETVKLLRDVTLTSRVDTDFTGIIDLGGKTVTSTATCANGSAFNVKSGSVTIQNGNIVGVEGWTSTTFECDPITVRSGADLTLKDVSISISTKNGACVYPFDGAKVTILSGTYQNTTAEVYDYKDGWTGMAVNQANVAKQLIFIKGGSFYQVDPNLGDDYGKVSTFLAPGYKSEAKVIDGKTWYVVSEDDTTFVAKTVVSTPELVSSVTNDDVTKTTSEGTESYALATATNANSDEVAYAIETTTETTGQAPTTSYKRVETAVVTVVENKTEEDKSKVTVDSSVSPSDATAVADRVKEKAAAQTSSTITVISTSASASATVNRNILNTQAAANAVAKATAKDGVNVNSVAKVELELQTVLTGYTVGVVGNNAAATKVIYDVTPVAVLKSDEGTALASEALSNDDLAAQDVKLSFDLPIPDDLVNTALKVKVTHVSEGRVPESKNYTVLGDSGSYYVAIEAKHFSEFQIERVSEATSVVDLSSENYVDSYSLTLESDIGVNFYLKLTDDVINAGDSYVTVNVEGMTHQSFKFDVSGTDGLTYNKSSDDYTLTCSIAPKDYQDTITLTLHSGNAIVPLFNANGVLDEDGYSYTRTLEQVINVAITNGEADLKPLAQKLMAYCANTKVYFKEDLQSSAVLMGNQSATADALKQYAIKKSFTNVTVEEHRSTLVLGSETSIKLVVRCNDGIEGHTFQYGIINGDTVTGLAELEKHYNISNQWYVKIEDIAATELGTTYGIYIDGQLVEKVSALSWANAMINNAAAYKSNVANAMYWYNQAALTYFTNQSNQ